VTSRGSDSGDRKFENPVAFRQALEARLRSRAKNTEQPFSRVQRIFVYDRFLARLQQEDGPGMIVKGGMALELRLERARTTMDIDVRWPIDAEAVQARLERAGRMNLGDFMRFEVRPNDDHPDIDEAARYEGRRFRVSPFLGEKPYVGHFGVDVITGGPMLRGPDEVHAVDVLDFAGIAPPKVQVLAVETHIAEKLHAYTVPRKTPNSRVKDLPDIALLATTTAMRAEELRRALTITFNHRGTHAVPSKFPDPRPDWAEEYARMAAENTLPWTNLSQVTAAARAFVEPVLNSAGELAWNPETWRWEAVDDGAAEPLPPDGADLLAGSRPLGGKDLLRPEHTVPSARLHLRPAVTHANRRASSSRHRTGGRLQRGLDRAPVDRLRAPEEAGPEGVRNRVPTGLRQIGDQA